MIAILVQAASSPHGNQGLLRVGSRLWSFIPKQTFRFYETHILNRQHWASPCSDLSAMSFDQGGDDFSECVRLKVQ